MISKMSRSQEHPAFYNWDCTYEEIIDGDKKTYEDNGHISIADTGVGISTKKSRERINYILRCYAAC